MPGHLYQGGIWMSRGGHKSRVCVWQGGGGGAGGVHLWSLAVADARQSVQSLSYVSCFITFAFEIVHIQQGGERMESGEHSNSVWVGGGHGPRMPPLLGAGPVSAPPTGALVGCNVKLISYAKMSANQISGCFHWGLPADTPLQTRG